jgi:hypothetical protein
MDRREWLRYLAADEAKEDRERFGYELKQNGRLILSGVAQLKRRKDRRWKRMYNER